MAQICQNCVLSRRTVLLRDIVCDHDKNDDDDDCGVFEDLASGITDLSMTNNRGSF